MLLAFPDTLRAQKWSEFSDLNLYVIAKTKFETFENEVHSQSVDIFSRSGHKTIGLGARGCIFWVALWVCHYCTHVSSWSIVISIFFLPISLLHGLVPGFSNSAGKVSHFILAEKITPKTYTLFQLSVCFSFYFAPRVVMPFIQTV